MHDRSGQNSSSAGAASQRTALGFDPGLSAQILGTREDADAGPLQVRLREAAPTSGVRASRAIPRRCSSSCACSWTHMFLPSCGSHFAGQAMAGANGARHYAILARAGPAELL